MKNKIKQAAQQWYNKWTNTDDCYYGIYNDLESKEWDTAANAAFAAGAKWMNEQCSGLFPDGTGQHVKGGRSYADWRTKVMAHKAIIALLIDNRCKHDVHDLDCFDCHPTKDKL